LLKDTLLADLRSTTVLNPDFIDDGHIAVLHCDSQHVMASRLSTDSLDAEGQVSFSRMLLICH